MRERSIALLALALLAGCIREDRAGCPPSQAGRSVVLKIVDAATGRDITESGAAGEAELFLFSPDGTFAGRVSVGSEQVVHHVPVPLPGADPGACRISVWANAGEGQLLRIPADGSRIGEAAVSLIGDGDGYHGVPDDLYFGSAQPAPADGETPEEVVVVRKNARMHITVRGLDAGLPEERYYLTVRLPDDGYDYEGNPAGGTATIRRSGAFDDRGDLTTGAAFNVIHSGTVAEAVTVTLYERAAGRAVADRAVIAVTKNDDGLPIALPSGRTSNLLIDLRDGTGVTIRTEITPWNEVYQWEIW